MPSVWLFSSIFAAHEYRHEKSRSCSIVSAVLRPPKTSEASFALLFSWPISRDRLELGTTPGFVPDVEPGPHCEWSVSVIYRNAPLAPLSFFVVDESGLLPLLCRDFVFDDFF